MDELAATAAALPEAPPAAAAAAAPAPAVNDAEVVEDAARALSEAFATRQAAGLPSDYVAWSKLILLDAGFGSVKLAVALGKRGIHVIAGVKMAHVGFPKAWLLNTLKEAPSGTWCVLVPVQPIEGVEIVAIGYKYNAKKVLFFVMTKGAGSTESGAPYVAKFPDRYGNRCTRNVERPACLSRLFHDSPKVDNHNMERQGILSLEGAWQTQNCWFRLFCTIQGINTIDTKLAVQYTVHDNHEFKTMTVMEFTDRLAREMLENTLDEEGGAAAAAAPRQSAVRGTPRGTKRVLDQEEHTPQAYGYKTLIAGERAKHPGSEVITQIQKVCVVCARKSGTYCKKCGVGTAVCKDGIGKKVKRLCMTEHADKCRAGAEKETGWLATRGDR